VLRDKWPIAFPADAKDLRPLAIGAAGEIAATMNWSLPYTLGVLARWKMSSAYCKSVLAHEHRIGLDGSTAEPIDVAAKDLATKQLERLAARETAKAAEPVPMKRKSAERPPETPKQLRARVRTSLMRRKA
jgi:sRNA-binding protein